jgi:hypothetical protein
MKISLNFFLLGSFILLPSFMFSQGALQHMQKISDQFQKIAEETWDYTRTAAHSKKLKKIENRRKDVINANRMAVNQIKNMEPFNNDASFRDSVVQYLELSYAVMNDDYSKIVDLEEVAEESYDAMDAYMKAQEIANDKLDEAWDVVQKAQESFANKYNITLISQKSKTEAKLEKAGDVYKHYKKVFLALFKPFKQEFYLLDALSKNDINAIKQNQEAMVRFAKESKEILKPIEPYHGNVMLKSSCNDALNFFIYEGETKGNFIVDFYLKKENLEKQKAIVEKNGDQASKEEIEAFNKSVNEFNKMVITFNNLNNELNNRRNAVNGKWNDAVTLFFEKNIAKK